MKARRSKKKIRLPANRPKSAAEAKGREIIASLKELVETAEAGIPLGTRFIVRTVDVPDPPTKPSRKRGPQRPVGQLSPKAREIIASLNEAIEVERLGVPIESRFTARTVGMPDHRSSS